MHFFLARILVNYEKSRPIFINISYLYEPEREDVPILTENGGKAIHRRSRGGLVILIDLRAYLVSV